METRTWVSAARDDSEGLHAVSLIGNGIEVLTDMSQLQIHTPNRPANPSNYNLVYSLSLY